MTEAAGSASSEALLISAERGVAQLTLNRPHKRNALSGELIAALAAGLSAADADAGVRVVALRGAGPDFCSGADLESLRTVAEGSVLENLEDVDRLADLFLQLRRMRKPVVALVHGRALAGGCGLATACDLVLAEAGARLGYTEVRLGFVPAMVTAILRRSVGERRAFELIATGRVLDAAEAERIGLVNRVVPAEEFEGAAAELLRELAEGSASAVQLCKRLLYHQDAMSFEQAIRAGADLNVLARMTDDTRAGVARFLAGGAGDRRS